MDFQVALGPDDHAFHKVFEPVMPGPAYPGKHPRYGMTVRASVLPKDLLAIVTVKTARIEQPYPVFDHQPYVTMLGPRRIEVDNSHDWEATDRLLREAAARNQTRDWIFRGRCLFVTGHTYDAAHLGPRVLINIDKIVIQ